MNKLKVFADLPQGAIQSLKDIVGVFALGIVIDSCKTANISENVIISPEDFIRKFEEPLICLPCVGNGDILAIILKDGEIKNLSFKDGKWNLFVPTETPETQTPKRFYY